MTPRTIILFVLPFTAACTSDVFTGKPSADGGGVALRREAGTDGAEAGATSSNTCDSRLGTSACETCFGQRCCTESKACLDDPACAAACGPNGSTDACASNELGRTLIDCASASCTAECQ